MNAIMSNRTTGIALEELLRELVLVRPSVVGDAGVVVSDVRTDSRHVSPGDLFIARAGRNFDAARFVSDATARGAAAVLVERGVSLPPVSVPVVRVDDVRLAVALAAESVRDHPTRALRVVGITGTNGKTTTAWLATHAIDGAGGRAARLGTLGYMFGADVDDASLTTPEADDISRLASRALARGATHFVMEVSSVALTQARGDGIAFAVAAFTNLTQDHLDYHGSMAAYAAAKARLFTDLEPAASVINIDDPFGGELVRRAHGRVLSVARSVAADVRPLESRMDEHGVRAMVRLPSGNVALESPLVGAHNLDNLLVALAIVEALGLDTGAAARALRSAPAVPGRLERCDTVDDDVTVLVDYAHTPDALRRVLQAVRGIGRGKVHCVFGCGGDRDASKRPKMGACVGEAADRATITNDNPRSEDPRAIATAIEAGLRPAGIPYEIVLDRAAAIERAICEAAPGDIVLLAGKGHESYQITATEKSAFDDRVEARRALGRRRGAL